MKKILVFIIIIILLLTFAACGKSADEKSEQADAPADSVGVSSNQAMFTLHMLMTDEEGEPCIADTVTFQTADDQIYETTVTDGEFSIALPITQKMKGTLTAEKSRVGTFGLSIWNGYTLGYHNNLSFMSIDVPGNTSDLYLKVTVCKDVEKVYCTHASPAGYEELQQNIDLDGVEIDEETAVNAGLYGIRYAATTGLNLRSQPDAESSSIMKLNFGEQLNLMNSGEEVNGTVWYKVLVDGEHEGYVSGEYIGKRYTITKNGVNIRTQPNTDGDVVNMIGAGSVVVAMDEGTQDGDHKWYFIKTRAGLEGYVRNDFMTMS